MDLRQNQLPWSEQIWAKINADLAQALTQARRVRGPFEVFHVPDSQQTVLADKRDPNAESQFDYTESESMPIVELAVNFSLAQTQVFNEGDNFYALDRVVGAAYDLGQAEDELITHGLREKVVNPFTGVYVSKVRDRKEGGIWEGIEYSDVSKDWKEPLKGKLEAFVKLPSSVDEATLAATAMTTASKTFIDDKDPVKYLANLESLRRAARNAASKVADANAYDAVASLQLKYELALALLATVQTKVDPSQSTGADCVKNAIKEAKNTISIEKHTETDINAAAETLRTQSPTADIHERMATALLLIALCGCDAKTAVDQVNTIGTPGGSPQRSSGPGGSTTVTGGSLLKENINRYSKELLKRLDKADSNATKATNDATRKGFRPAHPATVFWRGREGHCIPHGKTGFEVYNAVLEARDRLRKLSRYESFALLISTDMEGDLQSTVPNTNSLNTPIERLRPLVTAGVYSTSALGEREMYVIAVARSWIDIAQAMEPSVQFLNINPDDGSYKLRLVERFAFRLKDGTARCKVVMCSEDPDS